MSLFNAYVALSDAIDGEVLREERMSRHTSWRIGGPAALYVRANTTTALTRTIDVLSREGVEWVILGKGSNVLVSDQGYNGCVITLGRDFSRISSDAGDGIVTAGAGVVLARLVGEVLKRSLAGLECCVGIPGCVGGAVSMNAGTAHEWIGSVVSDVVTLRPGHGLVRYDASEIAWEYRKTSIPANEIILEATLALTPSDRESISREMNRRLQARHRTQPTGKPSCGSVFRNPPGQSVGKLLESCGLKGYSVGGAQISDIHANFIVNNGGATAQDALAVMRQMFQRVKEDYGIELQPEVKFLGSFT